MAKVSVDISTCVGCGLCEQTCPEIFKVESDGLAHVKAQNCAAHSIAEIAELCPVTAIKLV